MFETLHAMTAAHAERAADALYTNGQVAFIVDPRGIYILLTATPAKPYEVDFQAVLLLGSTWAPAPLTTLEYAVIHTWARDAIPQVCIAWKERHPDGPRTPEPQKNP